MGGSKGSRYLELASRYATEKNVFKFLRIKRYLRKHLVKTYVTTGSFIETTVPEPGCYIVHMIGVGRYETRVQTRKEFNLIELLRAVYTDVDSSTHSKEHREWVKRLKRFAPALNTCLLKVIEKHRVTRPLSIHDVVDLVHRYYDEVFDCVAEHVRSTEGCGVKEIGILKLFECTYEQTKKVRVVRHAVRLVEARAKTVKGHTYHVIKARVPQRLKQNCEKIYVHVIKGVCVDLEGSNLGCSPRYTESSPGSVGTRWGSPPRTEE